MHHPLSRLLRASALALALALPAAAPVLLAPSAAQAQDLLPAPHLSRALDALLLPVDDAVRATFGLAPETTGVFLLAIAPGGLAESAGLAPGDVLDYVQGTEILSPTDLDDIILAWLDQGMTDFTFDGLRAGSPLATDMVITLEYWEETVEITEIATWSSYTSESFSYEEFSASYSEEISAGYDIQDLDTATEDTMMEDSAEDLPPEEDIVEDDGGSDEIIEE